MMSGSTVMSLVRVGLRLDTPLSATAHHNPRRCIGLRVSSTSDGVPTTTLARPHRRRAALMRGRTTKRMPTMRTAATTTAGAAAAAGSLESQQAEYTRWRDGKGIKSPNVEVAYFGEADDTVMRYRGVRAKSKVREGDVLVELPRDSCLVLMDDAELPFPDFCTGELWAKLTEKNKWALKVALNLLHEVNKGPDSQFHTYIEQLPKDFDLLSMWSDEVGGEE